MRPATVRSWEAFLATARQESAIRMVAEAYQERVKIAARRAAFTAWEN